MFLIGLTVALTVPRFRYAMLTDDLRATVRKMVGKIRDLRTNAIGEQKAYKLRFDLESNRYWGESEDITDEDRNLADQKGTQLPKGVRILDVWTKARGKAVEGSPAIYFTKKGYFEPSAIHIAAEDGREFTLVLRPFLGKVKVLEKYVEFGGI
jgi:general secretion pathway protein H